MLVLVVCVWQSFRAGMGVISPGSSCVCLAELKSWYGSDQCWFYLCMFGRVLELVCIDQSWLKLCVFGKVLELVFG